MPAKTIVTNKNLQQKEIDLQRKRNAIKQT